VVRRARTRRDPSVIEQIVLERGGRVVLALSCAHDVELPRLPACAVVGGGWPCRHCPPLAPLLPAHPSGVHARTTVPRRGVVVVLRAANESETSPVLSRARARAVGSR